SSRSSATWRAPSGAWPQSPPAASLSSAANPGQARAEARAIASCSSSPNVASPTGASIPAATPLAPAPGSSRSSTRTRSPRCAARHAQARPIAPPPTTTASSALPPRRGRATTFPPSLAFGSDTPPSLVSLGGRSAPPSLRRHYPDQVQTVGGPDAALSALACWAPVASMVLPPRGLPDTGSRDGAEARAGAALLRLRRAARRPRPRAAAGGRARGRGGGDSAPREGAALRRGGHLLRRAVRPGGAAP